MIIAEYEKYGKDKFKSIEEFRRNNVDVVIQNNSEGYHRYQTRRDLFRKPCGKYRQQLQQAVCRCQEMAERRVGGCNHSSIVLRYGDREKQLQPVS